MELEAERGARGKAEVLVSNLRSQLEGVRAAEEAARAAAQRTLALLEAEVSALKVQPGTLLLLLEIMQI